MIRGANVDKGDEIRGAIWNNEALLREWALCFSPRVRHMTILSPKSVSYKSSTCNSDLDG
jgi:hypothetical protein